MYRTFPALFLLIIPLLAIKQSQTLWGKHENNMSRGGNGGRGRRRGEEEKGRRRGGEGCPPCLAVVHVRDDAHVAHGARPPAAQLLYARGGAAVEGGKGVHGGMRTGVQAVVAGLGGGGERHWGKAGGGGGVEMCFSHGYD
jgi:hypothetical protein